MSTASRLAALEQAIAGRRAPRVVGVQIVVVESRAQLAALRTYAAAHPQPPQPPAAGRIRLVQLPPTTAVAVLAEHNIFLPAENTNNDTISEETVL